MYPRRAIIALLVVCVFWGTTYFAMRIGVNGMPPYLFAGMRHTIAGVCILGYLLARKKMIWLPFRHIWPQVLVGFMMLSLGNGVIGWAEKYIPSGLAALIVSVMPIYFVGLNYIFNLDRIRLNWLIWAGLILGLVGVALIFKDNLPYLAESKYKWGVIASFLGSICWAAGSLVSKNAKSPAGTTVNAVYQLFGGGIALLIFSGFTEPVAKGIAEATTDSWLALAYLIVIGSILTYLCYLYALEKLPVGLVGVYAYINPFIALVLGYVLLQEPLTPITFLALGTTLLGVLLINRGYRIRRLTDKSKTF